MKPQPIDTQRKDAEEWLGYEATRRKLPVSREALATLVASGAIETRFEALPSGKTTEQYKASDVDRIAAEYDRQRTRRARPKAMRNEEALAADLLAQMTSHESMRLFSERLDAIAAESKRSLEIVTANFEKSLKLITSSILDAHKAERDDARERWELERQDRLERERRRSLAAQAKREPAKAKAKRAHA